TPLRAWQRLPDLRSEERIDSWFGRILVNVCRDRLRSRRSIVRWAPSHVATNDPADKVERDQLEAALSDLSPDHRIAVVLRYFGDLSVDDIAIRTRTTHGTVKSR